MNAPVLTPLALANVPILQQLRDGGHSTVAELAKAIGRDNSNVSKSLKALEASGLAEWPGEQIFFSLTDAGTAALEAWERAELMTAPEAHPTPPPIYAWQVRPDPENPRRDFESEEALAALQELTASIVKDGLIENLVVRPIAGTTVPHPETDEERPAYMLIAGERRWRAICAAIAQGDLPLDWPVPLSIREVDEVTARRLALVENLQRRDLKPLEEARALQQLVELDGRSTVEIANDIGFTQRWAQQRLQLLQLSPAMQALLDAGQLKIEGARIALSIWDKLPPIKRAELEAGKIRPEEAKAWLDQQPTPLSDAAKLAIMEFLQKAADAPYTGGYGGKGTKILGTIERTDRGENGVTVKVKIDDPKGAFAELRKARLVEDPGRVYEESVETGEAYLSTGYGGEWNIKQVFPTALDARWRKKNIPTLRVQVYGLQVDCTAEKEGSYATPWLNTPPFTPTAEVQAEIEQKRAARLERERKYQEEQRQREAKYAEEQRQRKARLAAAAALEPELRQARAENLGAFTGSLISKSVELGWTLPLFLDEDGQVVDAAGQEVSERVHSYQRDERLPFLRFLVATVNVAAGLETPATRPVEMDPDAIPREDFLAQVVTALLQRDDEGHVPSEEAAEAMAEKALDAMLAEEGWVYGEAYTYDWNANGAASLAGAIERGEYQDEQLDIEDVNDPESDPFEACSGCGEEHPIGVLDDGLCPSCCDEEA